MSRKPLKTKGIFTRGMTWRIIYQGIMIGLLALSAFVIGISTTDGEALKFIADNDGTLNNEIIKIFEDHGDGTARVAPDYLFCGNEGGTSYYAVGFADFVPSESDIVRIGKHEMTIPELKVEIGQAMTFIVLAFSELVHIFNIRNSKKSIFKTGIGGNKLLFLAIFIDSCLMFAVLLIPALRSIFGIPLLPSTKIVECICLVFAPILIVEIMKLLKLNSSKEE